MTIPSQASAPGASGPASAEAWEASWMLCRQPQSSTLWQKKIRDVHRRWVKAKEISRAVAGIERVSLGSHQSPLSRFRVLLRNEAHAHSAVPTQWRERKEETFRPSLQVHRSFDPSQGPLRWMEFQQGSGSRKETVWNTGHELDSVSPGTHPYKPHSRKRPLKLVIMEAKSHWPCQ